MDLEKLLTLLADGRFHSGEELSVCLEVSRTAIWKQIAKLEALGLEINAVKGKGYRLRQDIDLLSLQAIYECLDDATYSHMGFPHVRVGHRQAFKYKCPAT